MPEPEEVEEQLQAGSGVKLWCSLGTTIRTADYENQKIDLGISGVPLGASDEYIQNLVDEANITLQKMVYGLATEMSRILREDYGR